MTRAVQQRRTGPEPKAGKDAKAQADTAAIARMVDASAPAAGSPGMGYLRGREITEIDGAEDIRFLPAHALDQGLVGQLYKGTGATLVLSRLRSGLPIHLGSLSLEGQGTFATQR